MHIVFTKSYDIWELGAEAIVEHSLGAKLCRREVAVPYTVYLDNRKKAKAIAEVNAKKLKAKKEAEKEFATSKKAANRSKAAPQKPKYKK